MVLEISDGFSKQNVIKKDIMLSTLMRQSLMMFKNVNLYKYKSSSNSHQNYLFLILFFMNFFFKLQPYFDNIFIII